MNKLLLMSLLIALIITSCEKERSITVPPPERLNFAPQAYAGANFRVALPTDSATLFGSFTDTPYDIVHHTWKKISGPSSYVMERPGSLHTKVYNLEIGIYEFELTVTDKGGLIGKDTVSIDVYDPYIAGLNELIFNNLEWIFPWYAAIEVKNIFSYSTPEKVFVQRDFDSTWIEVKYISYSNHNNQYEYFIETRQPDGAGMYHYGSLYIFYYGSNTTDRPNVKIQF